jgi:hypothetical protein
VTPERFGQDAEHHGSESEDYQPGHCGHRVIVDQTQAKITLRDRPPSIVD